MDQIRGTLIPIGGNEDKGKKERTGLDFIEKGILSRVVKESGGPDSKILVIPTASSIPKKVGHNYLDAFGELGCTDVTLLNLTDPVQCEDPENLSLVDSANCLMFSGGNQSKITTVIGDTSLHKLISKKFIHEDFVVAGTSAGAMAMTEEMIAGGSSTEAFFKGAVIMRKGLGLIPELVIDTHFIRRGRFGRLAEAVAIYPHCIGIGLAEDTGLVIKNRNKFSVIGSGMIVLMDGHYLTHNKHDILEDRTPLTMSNLVTHILAQGDQFILDGKKVTVIPDQEPVK